MWGGDGSRNGCADITGANFSVDRIFGYYFGIGVFALQWKEIQGRAVQGDRGADWRAAERGGCVIKRRAVREVQE